MNSIIAKVKKIALEKATALNLELIDVEWVNEFGTFILRIIADTEIGLTIDESAALNEAISEALDEFDFIEEEYMLEVSSPGIERELKNDEDIQKNIDKYVHIDFLTHFEVSAKTKVLDIEGYLRKFENNVLEIEYNNKGQIKKLLVDKQQIKLIRLAIKF